MALTLMVQSVDLEPAAVSPTHGIAEERYTLVQEPALLEIVADT